MTRATPVQIVRRFPVSFRGKCMEKENMPELRLDVHTEQFRLRPSELRKMQSSLGALRKAVVSFPVSRLHVAMTHFPRSNDFQVRTTLFLPRHALFAGERDALLHCAYEHCLHALMENLREYKEHLENKSQYQRLAQGNTHEFLPTSQPDLAHLNEAVEQQDYSAFREALSVFDEALQARIGRWIRRYPVIEAQLGRQFLLSEIVEEVYLNAFDQYSKRPEGPLGQWLEGLIDPSIKMLIKNPDGEIENLRYIKSAES